MSDFVKIDFSYVCMYVHEYSCPQGPEEKGVGSPEAGIIGGCELSDVDAGDCTRILCNSSTSS